MLEGESKLSQALNNWQHWPMARRPKLLRVFTQGLNHTSGFISDGDNHFVLKIFANADPRAIDIQKFAAKHDLAPEILYANPESTLCLSRFIEDGALSKETISSATIQNIARALHKLHKLSDDPFCKDLGEFDYKNYCVQYLSDIRSNGFGILELQQQLKPILNHFIEDSSPKVLCHNDLVSENCFIEEDSVRFIDWEYAQFNNPWFDIAAVIYYLGLNQESAKLFLKHYHPDYLALALTPIYYSSQCALLWIDILWHLAQEREVGLYLEPKMRQLTKLIELFGDSSNAAL